jgi:hypothetical protein
MVSDPGGVISVREPKSFVAFDAHEATWTGQLTAGKPILIEEASGSFLVNSEGRLLFDE